MKLIMTNSWPGSTKRRSQWFSGWEHMAQQQSINRTTVYSANSLDPWSYCWNRTQVESNKRP